MFAPSTPSTPSPERSAPSSGRSSGAGNVSTQPAPGSTNAPVEGQVLDDDAFFATLRDAVRDDAPLGPRDDASTPAEGSADSDDDSRFGSVFKRRR